MQRDYVHTQALKACGLVTSNQRSTIAPGNLSHAVSGQSSRYMLSSMSDARSQQAGLSSLMQGNGRMTSEHFCYGVVGHESLSYGA